MSTPLFCPVCHFIMSRSEDNTSFEESNCCFSCQNNWGKNVDYSKIDVLPQYKEYLEKRLNQTKSVLPILRFD